MVLRVEDTDAERSEERHLERLLADLRWLGVEWDEGPDVGGPHGPYRQSERGAVYAAAIARLRAARARLPVLLHAGGTRAVAPRAAGRGPPAALRGHLRVARGRRGRAAHRAGAGACHALPRPRRARRRIRRPDPRAAALRDRRHRGLRREPRRRLGGVLPRQCRGRRRDGRDARAAWRRSPRQHAAADPAARGARPARAALRAPAAAARCRRARRSRSATARPGCTTCASRATCRARSGITWCGWDTPAARDEWLEADAMPAHFDLGRSSRSAARFDEAQLRHWQREAVTHASVDALVAWLGARLDALGDAARKVGVRAAVRGNLLFPADAEPLVAVGLRASRRAGRGRRGGRHRRGRRRVLRHARSASGRRTRENSRPGPARSARPPAARARRSTCRCAAALTGMTHGPELAPLAALMGRERVAARLARPRGGPARRRDGTGFRRHWTMLQIHNSLTGRKEAFRPIVPGEVRMYVCGMTVYDYCHLGHARMLIAFDVARRHLRPRATASPSCATSPTSTTRSSSAPPRTASRWTRSPSGSSAPTTRTARRSASARADHEPRATEYLPQIIAMIGDADREGPRLRRRQRRRVLLRVELRAVRAALGQAARGPARRRAHRGGRGEARSARLRAVEGGEARRAVLGFAVGRRPARAGTSSARPCRWTCSGPTSTSTAAAWTSSSRITRTRSRRPARPATRNS